MSDLASSVAIGLWLIGLVITEGFWWVTLSVLVPPVGMYFGAEFLLKHFGLI